MLCAVFLNYHILFFLNWTGYIFFFHIGRDVTGIIAHSPSVSGGQNTTKNYINYQASKIFPEKMRASEL